MSNRVFIYVSTFSLVLIMQACSGGSQSPIALQSQSRSSSDALPQNADVNARIEASIDKSIHGPLRQRIHGAMLQLQKSALDHVNQNMRFVQVTYGSTGPTIISNKAGPEKSVSYLLPTNGTSNVYAKPMGGVFAAPPYGGVPRPSGAGRSDSSLMRSPASVYLMEDPNSGEYRRISTPDSSSAGYQNYNAGAQGYNEALANLALPCESSASFDPGDGAYVYFESRSDYDPNNTTTGLAVEAGLQYQAGTGTYAPYFRVSSDPGGHANGFVYYNDATISNSNPYHVSWDCRNPPESNLSMDYSIGTYVDANGNNTSFTLDTQEQSDANNYVVMQYIIPNSAGYPWKNYDEKCSGCVLMRMTSIAQPSSKFSGSPPQGFSDGSYFGPTAWSGSQVGANGAFSAWPNSNLCEDYPRWTDAYFNECYSGPPSNAQYGNVQVNYTDMSTEDVTISD